MWKWQGKQYQPGVNVIGRTKGVVALGREIEKRTILLYKTITMYNLDISLAVNCGLVTFCDRSASVTLNYLFVIAW